MSYGNKRAMAKYGKVAAQSEGEYATPHRLVQMLMEGALDKMATAKGCMQRKDLAGKSAQITWATTIINGLRASLDPERGGEIAANLDDLYSYMLQRLVDASVRNDPAILDEVMGLMLEIKGAWDAMPEHIRNARQVAAEN
ncbi:MAG TPA: flagellar export chaperone FliS [Gammaproteobacteria bacterium]|nr:flagellar export chaperone FliS [Gammaproteobacteria bacterium]